MEFSECLSICKRDVVPSLNGKTKNSNIALVMKMNVKYYIFKIR